MSISLFGMTEEEKKYVETLKYNNTELKKGLASWKDGYNDLKPKYDTLKEETQTLKTKCQHLEEQKKELGIENSALKTSITTLQEKARTLEGEARPLRERLALFEKELKTIENTSREIETQLKRELLQHKETIKALSKDVRWQCIGLKDNELGFKGFDSINESISIVRIPRSQFQEIPDAVQDGYEVFGSSQYPAVLLDTIRSNIPLYMAILNGEDQISIVAASQNTKVKPAVTIKEQSPAATQQKADNIQDEKDTSSDTTQNPSPSPNEERVLKYLEEYPGSSHGDIAEALDIDKGYLSRLLKSLTSKDLIVEERDGYHAVDS